VCTHKKNLLLVFPKDKTKIVCSGHDSKFSAEGMPLEGPAKKPLPRFGIKLTEKGRVLVDPEVVFEQKDWGRDGAFVKVG
jgi:nitrite reductase/ring-hydroxylating ferredoxin subunit